MQRSVNIGGVDFVLDPSAISCVRYRARYGGSVVTHLTQAEDSLQLEGYLLRMVHVMIPPEGRPRMEEFAKLAHHDPDFIGKARKAQRSLLALDPAAGTPQNQEDGEFDEYDILASMTLAGLDMGLIYELPLMHLVSVLNRCGALRDPERKTYRKMDGREMAALYGGPSGTPLPPPAGGTSPTS